MFTIDIGLDWVFVREKREKNTIKCTRVYRKQRIAFRVVSLCRLGVL